MNTTTADTIFALRSFFKDRPLAFISIVFLVSVALFSFALRVA